MTREREREREREQVRARKDRKDEESRERENANFKMKHRKRYREESEQSWGRPCNFDTKPLHRWTECEGSPESCSMKGGRCQKYRDPQHCQSAARHVPQNYRDRTTLYAVRKTATSRDAHHPHRV